MKSLPWRSLIGAIAVSASALLPVQAATVTFEDAPTGLDSIFEDGQKFNSGGFLFTPTSLFLPPSAGALVGAVDTASGILIGAPPTNSDGRFYAGYNDGGLTMTTGNDRALFINSFDAAFIPFASGFYGNGDSPARLIVQYEAFTGGGLLLAEYDLAASDAGGEFAMRTISGAGLGVLENLPLASATFFVCVDIGNGCENPSTFNEAWFALDNISAEIPEPATPALIAAVLAFGWLRRRFAA